MKKTASIVLLLLSTLTLLAQKEFTIEGAIEGLDDTKIELMRTNGGSGSVQTVATTTTKDGVFTLKGKSRDGSEQMRLTVYRDNTPFYTRELWVAPNTVTKITGEKYLIDTWDIQNTVKEQEELNKYITANYDDLLLQQDMVETMIANMQIMNSPAASGQQVQQASTTLDSLQRTIMPIAIRIMLKEVEMMKASQPSLVWLDKLMHHAHRAQLPTYPISMDVVEELYNKMSDAQKSTQMAQAINNIISPAEKALLGKPAIDGNLKDLKGDNHKLADYRGKYVLIDFWASWCGPCLMAIPEMKEVQALFADNLTIVGINLDGKHGVWKKASEQHELTWVDLSEGVEFGKGLHAKYKGNGIPFYVLLSPEGTVIDIWSGYSKGSIMQKVGKLLNK